VAGAHSRLQPASKISGSRKFGVAARLDTWERERSLPERERQLERDNLRLSVSEIEKLR